MILQAIAGGSDRIRSADRVARGRLYISDEGDAVAPDGYCRELTAIIRATALRRSDEKDQQKAIRSLRALTSFELKRGEPWDAFLHEDDLAGERRVIALLKAMQCTTDKIALDGTIEVNSDSNTYLRALLVTIRQFYRALCRAHLHLPDSPMDVRNFRSWGVAERIRWAHARNYHPKWGIEHAGHRFFARDTESAPRRLYDPYNAARMVSEAMDRIEAPSLILELKDIARINGLRFSDFAGGTAYGYALAGLEDHFKCRNKQSRGKLTKSATMPKRVRAAVRARFEAVPHPHDPERTLWDRVVELSRRLALKGDAAEEAKNELERYSLFGRTECRDPYEYDAFRYWLRKAVRKFGVVLQTDLGPWYPTSIVFRKAAISTKVKRLFESTTDEARRKEGLRAICDEFGHSTDQTKVYADWEYELDTIRKRLRDADEQAAAEAGERAEAPVPVRPTELNAGAREWLDLLAARKREKTR